MRLFHLQRTVDDSGVSGTGRVAEGVEFSDGTCALHWTAGKDGSHAFYTSLAKLREIHGHDGHTEIVYAEGVEKD